MPECINFDLNGKLFRLRVVENATEVEMADKDDDDVSSNSTSKKDGMEL